MFKECLKFLQLNSFNNSSGFDFGRRFLSNFIPKSIFLHLFVFKSELLFSFPAYLSLAIKFLARGYGIKGLFSSELRIFIAVDSWPEVSLASSRIK